MICPDVTLVHYFPELAHVSGEQRLKMAQERAQEKATLQKDLDVRRTGSGVHIKQEPVGEDETMDTSSSSIPNGSVNGYPSAISHSFDHANRNGGSPADTSSLELQDFVIKTFRKHFVVTLNEFKRLLNLHLASMPVGRSVFHSISDHMLTDAIVLCHCKQIMVPVSIFSVKTRDVHATVEEVYRQASEHSAALRSSVSSGTAKMYNLFIKWMNLHQFCTKKAKYDKQRFQPLRC